MKKKHQWLDWAIELQAIAQNGLAFCHDPFDKERYIAIRDMAAEILAHHSDHEQEVISKLFINETGYATPKVDVRGVVFKDNKILLIQEMQDGFWTLPGGWADVNESLSDCVCKEIYEESGFKTKANKLLAVYDNQSQGQPTTFAHIVKCFFLCEIIGGKARTSFESLDVGFLQKTVFPNYLYRVCYLNKFHECLRTLKTQICQQILIRNIFKNEWTKWS